MKKILLFVVIFSLGYFQGQIRNPSHETLLGYEKKALSFEAQKNYNEALRLYSNITLLDSVSDLSKRAVNKINFLLPICRAKTVNQLIGKWKLKKKIKGYETDITFTNIIEFTAEKINFIEERECEGQVIESHDLLIEPFIQKIDSDFPTIKFGDNEIWFLSFREINNKKRLIWERRVDKNGNMLHTLDERSIIKDPWDQKKALEEEINTYYIKME